MVVGVECRQARARRSKRPTGCGSGGVESDCSDRRVSHPSPELDVRTWMREASGGRPAAFGLAGRTDLGTSASGGSNAAVSGTRSRRGFEAQERFEPLGFPSFETPGSFRSTVCTPRASGEAFVPVLRTLGELMLDP